MSDIQGTYRDGHIELDRVVNWPNGARVEVTPVPILLSSDSHWGIDDDLPDTPENRAEILRRMDAVEPLEMTSQEEAEWRTALKWSDDYSREVVKRQMRLSLASRPGV